MTAGFKDILKADTILNTQVAAAVTVIGDRWAFMIIRDVYLGIRRFEALKRSTGAARGTLASRLKALVANGILYKQVYESSSTRQDYRLTDKGLGLYPVVLTLWVWDSRWASGSDLPQQLIHKVCGHATVPTYQCGTCREAVKSADVSWSVGPSFQVLAEVPPRHQRRTKSPCEQGNGAVNGQLNALDCIGDRWTSLVLAAAFFGLRRFDDITSAIGIATNILSDRLRLLVQAQILEKVMYQEQPLRNEYRLTDKGRDLYPYVVALHDWANRWLVEPGKGALLLQHTPCNTALRGEIICSHCQLTLYPQDVTYGPV